MHFLLFFVGPYCAVGTTCNDRKFFLYAAGGLGALNLPPPQQVQGRGLVGSRGQGPLQLRKSGILKYKIQPKNSTLWFSFLVQKEKIIHLMFQTRPITRLHEYSQVKSKILKLTLHLYIINIHQPLMQKPITRSLDISYWVGSHGFRDDS